MPKPLAVFMRTENKSFAHHPSFPQDLPSTLSHTQRWSVLKQWQASGQHGQREFGPVEPSGTQAVNELQ